MYADMDTRCVSAIVSSHRPGASISHQRDKVRVQALFEDSDVGLGVFGTTGSGKSALLNLILRHSEHQGDSFVEGCSAAGTTSFFFGQCLGTNSQVCVFDAAGTPSLSPFFAYDAGRFFHGHQKQDSATGYARNLAERALMGLWKNLHPFSGHHYVARREDMVDAFALTHRLPSAELRLDSQRASGLSEALEAELALLARFRARMKAACMGVEPVTVFTFADELEAALGPRARDFREAVRAAAGDPSAFFVDCTAPVHAAGGAGVVRELIKTLLRRSDKALLARSRSAWFRKFHHPTPSLQEVEAEAREALQAAAASARPGGQVKANGAGHKGRVRRAAAAATAAS